MPGLATITVGVLSDKSGVDADTIRIYQRLGLLPKPRTVAGNLLLYRVEDIDRLIFIRRARDLGFSFEAITEMLELAQKRQKNCAQIHEVADRHLADIQHQAVWRARFALRKAAPPGLRKTGRGLTAR
jgi:MerR family mercuric resistance operon transcriptional regulator